jgi:hypothetical protein
MSGAMGFQWRGRPELLLGLAAVKGGVSDVDDESLGLCGILKIVVHIGDPY